MQLFILLFSLSTSFALELKKITIKGNDKTSTDIILNEMQTFEERFDFPILSRREKGKSVLKSLLGTNPIIQSWLVEFVKGFAQVSL